MNNQQNPLRLFLKRFRCIYPNFRLTAGNSESALNSPNRVLLTKSVVHRLFNDVEAMSKTIQLTNRDSGIIKIDLESMKG